MAEAWWPESATTLAQMNRRGLVLVATLLATVPLAMASCGGDDESAGETLPPIATTTSTTIAITTTTEYKPITYEILPGDGLGTIADKFGVDIDKLAILNGITNYDDIEAGDILNIPPPTTPPTVPTTSTTTTTIPLPTITT
jgi:LysM repeat protein